MPLEIVSGNLNVYGNAGQFETDRSTWGFADGNLKAVYRSSVLKRTGLYAALVETPFGNITDSVSVYGKWDAPIGTAGKKFWLKAWVRVPSATPFAGDAEVISIEQIDTAYLEWDPAYSVTKTILQATDAWVEISAAVTVTNDIGIGYFINVINVTGAHTVGGKIYIDDFEIFEVVEGEDEPDVCDVDIDEDATTVTNESGEDAGDGSIEVIATGTGTLEYSKDGGENYQLSNVFAGLVTGIYIIRVRQEANPDCYDEYPFAVNFDAVTHDFTTAITDESFAGLEDGAIDITPTGTGGPFEYSIDGGETFQAGNVFNDVAPGTYYVVVRNDAGNSVLHVVTVAAGSAFIDKTYFWKNPITLEKAAALGWDLLTNYRLYNDVRVEEEADSGVYESTLKVDLPPNSDGLVTFYLQEAFRDVFTLTPPTLNHANIIRLTDRIKRFKNFSGELENAETTPEELTASAANLVLWGGISKFHFPDINYFTEYISDNKKFLTWAPVEKYVDRQQEDYLNFWCYGNFTTLQLQIKAYFDDDTNETNVVTTLAGTGFTKLYQIPAGPANSGALLINPAKNLVKYELTLLDQNDDVISEVRTYYIEQVRHPLTRFLMFLNSLGAFEVLKFTGQVTETEEYNKEVVQRFLPHDYAALDGEFASNQVTSQKQSSISSGYVKGRLAKEWHEYLRDFLRSTIVFDVTDGNRVPIMITGGKHVTEDQNYERFIRVEVRDAYDNENFTPEEI